MTSRFSRQSPAPGYDAAVGEIHHQPDNQPDNQSRPVDPSQFVHHVSVRDDAQNRHQRNPRRAERPRLLRDWCRRNTITAIDTMTNASNVPMFTILPMSSIGVMLPTIAASNPTRIVFFHGVRNFG